MLAAIAQGTSDIRNWLPAGDTLATLEAIRDLGITVHTDKDTDRSWRLQVEGRGLHGLSQPDQALDCRNAGTCMRLLSGILVGQQFPSILDGSDQLRRRPMGRIVHPLSAMGAIIEATNGHPPLKIQPGTVTAIDYVMPISSAQVKSAILLAGLYAKGPVRVRQPGPSRDHTERMLKAMGIDIREEKEWIVLNAPREELASRVDSSIQAVRSGPDHLKPLDLVVPGDLSSAAFILVAASIISHSNVTVKRVGVNDTRMGLLDILVEMGAAIGSSNHKLSGGEPVADLEIGFGELHHVDVHGEVVVRAIDEFPIWAVAATQADGPSTLRGAKELRHKEVDRIALLTSELAKMGVDVEEQDDGFTINGPSRLRGTELDCHGDHRLAMALAVAGLVASSPSRVRDADCVTDSFPGFVEVMQSLGADIRWEDENGST
jgi:3-phosphoshikimate 1-carboxyvinyltransferase